MSTKIRIKKDKLFKIQQEVKEQMKPANLFVSFLNLFFYYTVLVACYSLVFNIARFIITREWNVFDVKMTLIRLAVFSLISIFFILGMSSWRKGAWESIKRMFSMHNFISYFMWYALVAFVTWAIDDIIYYVVMDQTELILNSLTVYLIAMILMLLFTILLFALLILLYKIEERKENAKGQTYSVWEQPKKQK